MVGIKNNVFLFRPNHYSASLLLLNWIKTAAEYGLTPPMPELRRRSIHSEKPCRTLVEPE